jgi:hypothetical protein
MLINKTQQDVVKASRDSLMEHFDTVRIFVTTHSGASETTQGFDTGGGNFFAQLGQIKEWVQQQNQISKDVVSSSNSEEEEV